MSELLVLFDAEYFKKIDGVAMCSPLGQIFANIFLSCHKQIWLKNCPWNLNLSFIKDMLMIRSCYFDQKFILKNCDDTLIANILILILHLREKKTILYRFLIFFFSQNDIHMFTNNIYNIKIIKIKETYKT